MTFVVPPKFLRNHAKVLELSPPADVGLQLIDYMCRRLGIADLNGLDMLDFGCGTRFADTLMNRAVRLGSYTGIDVHAEMIEFLAAHATDPRLSFFHLDAWNPFYNRRGAVMTADTALPVGGRQFDLICLLSVITHQLPADTSVLFKILRRHVRPTGRMFFTAYVHNKPGVDHYEEIPEQPGASSRYSADCLRRLLKETGWRIVSWAPPKPEGVPVMDSFLCEPGALD